MYYYGNNGYYSPGYGNPGYAGYVGCTTGYGCGAAIWIVLFILLVIILSAGLGFGNNSCQN